MPNLLEVTNLRDVIENHKKPIFIVPEPLPSSSQTKHLLFIHGADYHTPSEVIRDFALPYSKHSELLEKHKDCKIYLYHWNSNLIKNTDLRFSNYKSLLKSVKFLGPKIIDWSKTYRCLESRCENSARLLSKEFTRHFRNCHDITVVTHSLGARVWCQAIQEFAKNDTNGFPKNHWINLQPAIEKNAFEHQGAFHFIPDLYQQNGGRIDTLYSKYDMILSTIYQRAKKFTAMGQKGCQNLENLFFHDVSPVALESHGTLSLHPLKGCFFERVQYLLQTTTEVKL